VDSNQTECVKVLLDAGADANAADKDGLTPLHIAAHRGMQEVATMLLERDARIDAVDKVEITHCTIMHRSAYLSLVWFLPIASSYC